MADTFHGVLAFAFLSAVLLAGTILRARLPFLQHALVPASLIGGTLGFILLATGLSGDFASSDFGVFTFHFFTLSFMSLCLTGSAPGNENHSIPLGGTWLSAIWIVSLALQALLGLAAILLYNGMTGSELSAYLGLIATHGFTQGPGQAIALGSIWQESGIQNAVNFGLIYASLGFLVAFVAGVPVARWAIRRGLNANRLARIDDEFLRGIYLEGNRPETGREVTHSANVDSLAYHLGILGVAYLLTDAWIRLMAPVVEGTFLEHVFSYNLFFFHGLVVCVLMRTAIDRAGFGHMIDDNTQRRITGSSVDFMVVATLMSIEFGLLTTFLAPILLVAIAVSVGTALLCYVAGRNLGNLGVERALTIFGCCCGSTGTGLLLLRILDPDMRTPIAKELAFFNIAILVGAFHILTLMAPNLPQISLATIIAVYGLTIAVGLAAAIVIGRRMPAIAINPENPGD